MKKIILFIFVLLVAVSTVKAVVLDGTGCLHAEGSGDAIINAIGELTFDGRGVIAIKDEDTLIINRSGNFTKHRIGRWTYYSGEGEINIKNWGANEDMHVLIGGSGELRICGTGTVELEGFGYYITGPIPEFSTITGLFALLGSGMMFLTLRKRFRR